MTINPSDSVVLFTNIWYLHHSHSTYSTRIYYSHVLPHYLLLYFIRISYSYILIASVILL